MTNVDDFDPILLAPVEDRKDMPAGKSEEVLYAQSLQCVSSSESAVPLVAHRGTLSLVG
jgi:hypothetical protein